MDAPQSLSENVVGLLIALKPFGGWIIVRALHLRQNGDGMSDISRFVCQRPSGSHSAEIRHEENLNHMREFWRTLLHQMVVSFNPEHISHGNPSLKDGTSPLRIAIDVISATPHPWRYPNPCVARY